MGFKVQITNGAKVVVICDTPSPMTISGTQSGVDGIKQIEALYGSLAQFVAYRGNDLFTETFTIRRNTDDNGAAFADGFAARAWFYNHKIGTPRDGQIDFLTSGGNFRLAYGILLPITMVRQVGILLDINYSITGSPLASV